MLLTSFRIIRRNCCYYYLGPITSSPALCHAPYNFQAYKIFSTDNTEIKDDKPEEELVTSIGQKTHIPAPVIERPEFSPITQLGIREKEDTKDEAVDTELYSQPDEIITHIGDAPIEEPKEEAEEVSMIGEAIDISEMPYELLPKFIHKPKIPRLSTSDAISIPNTLSKIIEEARAKYDETVEAHFNLNVDPRKSDQLVRGMTVLPHGTGKRMKIAVFADEEDFTTAKNAGADIVGGVDLISRIEKTKGSEIKGMDKCIATPAMMKHLVKIGKILGPKGLMPNPKMGTLTDNIPACIDNLKKGKIEFRVDKTGVLHVPFGKVSFGPEKLRENLEVLGTSVLQCRPKTIKAKGHAAYITRVTLCSSIGRGFPILVPDLVSLVVHARKKFT